MSNQEKFDISGVDWYIYLRYNEKWCNYDRHAQDHTKREINSFWDLRSLLLRAKAMWLNTGKQYVSV